MKILYLFPLLLLLTACFGDDEVLLPTDCQSDCYVFIGRVIDPNNGNTAVPDATVRLEYRDGSGPNFISLGGSPNPEAVTKTDDSGNYRFDIDGSSFKRDIGYWKLKATKPGYLDADYEGTATENRVDSTDFDVPFVNDLEIKPAAKIILEVDVQDANYIVRYNYKYSVTRHGASFEDGQLGKQRAEIDVAGDQTVSLILIQQFKDEPRQELDKSVFIDAGETKSVHQTIPW